MWSLHSPIQNFLLASLPKLEYRQIAQSLTPVELTQGQQLCDVGEVFEYVYFPVDVLIALWARLDGNRSVALGLVGREGMTSIACALGLKVSPFLAVAQSTGTALRMNAHEFSKRFQSTAALRSVTLLHLLELTNQIAQTAACNRFHPVDQRLARWLLMARDRLSSNQLFQTHEALAHWLGVQRTCVTRAAHGLKLNHLIEYSRGAIEIVDAKGLQQASCACYRRLDGCHLSGR